jgi:hypothetical protein
LAPIEKRTASRGIVDDWHHLSEAGFTQKGFSSGDSSGDITGTITGTTQKGVKRRGNKIVILTLPKKGQNLKRRAAYPLRLIRRFAPHNDNRNWKRGVKRGARPS